MGQIEDLADHYQTAETPGQRQLLMDRWLELYQDAHIDQPYEWDEEDLPEMFDEYRTQAEMDLVVASMEHGVIPEHLSDGPKPYNTYFITCFISELDDSLSLDEEGLQERLEHLRELKNPHRGSRGLSDGSKGQWAAWNGYSQEAITWILGTHPQLLEEDDP